MTRHYESNEARLWFHIETLPESGCWLYGASSNSKARYGSIKYGGRVLRAHRFSWELYRGSVPEGLNVLHKCDIGFCVNPDHLFLGTQIDNAEDMLRKGRGNKASGLRNGRHTKPDRTCRGDAHPARRIPLLKAGESNGRAILTEADVLAIRAAPIGCWRLSKQYGVTPTTIKAIRNRKSWRHI